MTERFTIELVASPGAHYIDGWFVEEVDHASISVRPVSYAPNRVLFGGAGQPV